MNETKKINYITIAKGIGIILVVLGHCGNSTIEKFLLLFHMPLFFFISGFLFKDEKLENPIKYIKGKITRLYLPYLIYETIFLLLHNFFINVNIYNTDIMIVDKTISYLSIKDMLITFIKIVFCAGREPIGGALWFLVVLFFVTIVFFIISYIGKKFLKEKNFEKYRFIIIISLFFIGNILTKFGYTIPRANNTLVMLFIYYIGVITSKYGKFISYENIIIFIISVVGLIVNNLYGSVSVNNNAYLSPDFLIANTLMGTYAVMFLAKKIEKKKQLSKIFIKIGEESLHIMALHFLAFKLISLLRIIAQGLPIYNLAYFPVIKPVGAWIVLYLIAGITLPVITIKTIKLIKNKIVLINLKHD